MLIPGEIATLTYTFDRPGVYRTTCNEYCGGGHHTMMGTVRVLYPSEYAAALPAEGVATGSAVGEGVYTANCAGCHQADGQGLPGVFPPLAGHAAELRAFDGRNLGPEAVVRREPKPVTSQECPSNSTVPPLL